MASTVRGDRRVGNPSRWPSATAPRRARRLLLGATAVLVALLAGGSGRASAAPCWLPPVAGQVVDAFRDPSCRWCAGNRGIEYRTVPGSPVRAVAGGTVTFAGSVAGTRYVVVQHPDGRRATYGGIATTPLSQGDRVLARTVVGRSGPTLHFGLRAGEHYLDPAPYLGRLVGRPRLVPLDGTPARPAPPPRVRCG